MSATLVKKYNVPGPRYTSYPTVPYWNMDTFSVKKWKEQVQQSFIASNSKEGISIYIHLPFCESMCTFCGCHKRITKRHSVELPYIKALLKEWKLYCDLFAEKPNIKELHLGGGTPTFFSSENLKLLLHGIFRYANRSKDYGFSLEGHPNHTTEEQLRTLYELGFRRISFGVQDYNKTVQKAIHRVQPFAKVKKVTELARSIGFTSIGHDIIFGLPFQKTEHIEQTILRTKALMPDRLAFYSYAHVPWLKGNGQRGYQESNLPSATEKRVQYEKGKELLLQIGYNEIGMDHFALHTDSLYTAMESGRLHRNFMGYTASKTQLMIGLGASAISDSWYGFAQNVKSIEEYQNLLVDHIFPVYRGHALSNEDIVVRKHILNLMCGFSTSWSDTSMQFNELPNVLARLQEMESDGFLSIMANTLVVHTKGRPFVRNICMAFDLHLQGNQSKTKLFSMTV